MPRRVKAPQEHPNWKPFKGKHTIEYDSETSARRRKRNIRRKTLIQKAHELSVISGGQVFLTYIDDNEQTWTYSSSEELWCKYVTTGLRQEEGEKRCDEKAKVIHISGVDDVPPTPELEMSWIKQEVPDGEDVGNMECLDSDSPLIRPQITEIYSQHVKVEVDSAECKVTEKKSVDVSTQTFLM